VSDASFDTVFTQLWEVIESRKACVVSDGEDCSVHSSYTVQLLSSHPDRLLKKVAEEAAEVILAAKDCEGADMMQVPPVTEHGSTHEHLVYETCDLLYHLGVLCARYDITLDELAGELKRRFV